MKHYPMIAIPTQGGSAGQYTIIGTLPDCETCTVRQEYNNGLYELYLQYPQSGENYNNLQIGNFIVCKADKYHSAQAFRIARMHRAINGLLTLTAYHISYLHSSEIVFPFLNHGEQFSAQQAFQKLIDHTHNTIGGTKLCTITSGDPGAYGIHALKPSSVKAFLLDQLLPAYGGEVELDNLNITWQPVSNTNRGVRLQGAVDVTSASTDSDISNIETGIYAYYGVFGEGTYVSAGIVDYGIDLPTNIIAVDFTQKFESQPTVAQLTSAANAYKAKRISEIQPVKISIESIPKSDIIIPGDTVTIRIRQLDIDVERVVTAINFDVLRDCVDSVEVGTQNSTLAKIISTLR